MGLMHPLSEDAQAAPTFTVTLTAHGIKAGARMRQLLRQLQDVALEFTPATGAGGLTLDVYPTTEAAEAPPPAWAVESR